MAKYYKQDYKTSMPLYSLYSGALHKTTFVNKKKKRKENAANGAEPALQSNVFTL